MRLALMITTVVFMSVLTAAQIPLPSALLNAQKVYLTGSGDVDRKLLNRAADEIRKLERFQLVGDREDADLVFTVWKGQGDSASVLLPFATGVLLADISQDEASLVVQDATTDKLLYNDTREIDWFAGGAVADLIKDLHKEIAAQR